MPLFAIKKGTAPATPFVSNALTYSDLSYLEKPGRRDHMGKLVFDNAADSARYLAAVPEIYSGKGNARDAAYQASLQDQNIDAISRKELADLYAQKADPAQIASLLSAAQQGKGLYAIRKINEAQANISNENPGRRATVGATSLI